MVEKMKIDIFAHIYLKEYIEKINKKARASVSYRIPPVVELEERFRWMEENPDVVQVISMPNSAIADNAVSAEDNVSLCQFANDEIANLVNRYPERFISGVACLPLNNIKAAFKETERAIEQLKLSGIQLFTSITGMTVGNPRFRPLYEMIVNYNLPIWLHPLDPPGWGDNPFENQMEFGWPYHTSVAMLELVRTGVMEAYPDVKIITHHLGGMVPTFRLRVRQHTSVLQRFYADTAVHDVTSALMCGYDYFGADHVVFGTDMPFYGKEAVKNTIQAIEAMAIPELDKQKIFTDDARRLLRLPR